MAKYLHYEAARWAKTNQRLYYIEDLKLTLTRTAHMLKSPSVGTRKCCGTKATRVLNLGLQVYHDGNLSKDIRKKTNYHTWGHRIVYNLHIIMCTVWCYSMKQKGGCVCVHGEVK